MPFLFSSCSPFSAEFEIGFHKIQKIHRKAKNRDADLSLFLENNKKTYYEVLTIFQELLCFTNINSFNSHNTQTVFIVCFRDEETEANRLRKSPKGLC